MWSINAALERLAFTVPRNHLESEVAPGESENIFWRYKMMKQALIVTAYVLLAGIKTTNTAGIGEDYQVKFRLGLIGRHFRECGQKLRTAATDPLHERIERPWRTTSLVFRQKGLLRSTLHLCKSNQQVQNEVGHLYPRCHQHLTNTIISLHRKAAKELQGSKHTSPSSVMEEKLQKLKIELGQCNRRFGDLLTKLQELVADEQVQERVLQGSDKFRL